MAGLVFEEFVVGKTYKHEGSKTVTLADAIQYACMSMDPDPTYVDEEWAKRHARFGRIEVHPIYVLALVQAMQVTELTLGTTIGNISQSDITFPNPFFPGDTIRAQTTITGKRESKTRSDRGIVEFIHEGFNQRDELVARCVRKGMMVRRGAGILSSS